MEPGRVIADKYRLTSEIGKGGMGSVWSAVHQGLGRTVAVKFLRPQADHDASATDRFVSEARMVASIKHRFVVDVFDFGVTDDGLYYMVLELLDGSSLAERIVTGPAFTVRDAVSFVADCLRGLHAVHEAGVVHRDLKPENIFMIHDADGTFPKLIDFGISKKAVNTGALQPLASGENRSTQLTQPGTIVGTPYYMSPEQLRGRADLDRRADIYSMGVILYELIVGRLPFSQDNIGDLMVAITTQGAPALSLLRPELGKALSDVVTRALCAKAEDRYATALELRDALLAALSVVPAAALAGAPKPAGGAGGYGQFTELLMQAAADPFSGEASRAKRSASARKRLPLYVAAALLALATLGYLLGTQKAAPDSVTAAPAAAPAAAAAAPGAPTPAVPAAALEPGTPAVAADGTKAQAGTAPSAVPVVPGSAPASSPAGADTPTAAGPSAGTPSAPSAKAQQPAAKPASRPVASSAPAAHTAKPAAGARSGGAAPSKKIFHTLDF